MKYSNLLIPPFFVGSGIDSKTGKRKSGKSYHPESDNFDDGLTAKTTRALNLQLKNAGKQRKEYDENKNRKIIIPENRENNA